jgi:hypothetical protein
VEGVFGRCCCRPKRFDGMLSPIWRIVRLRSTAAADQDRRRARAHKAEASSKPPPRGFWLEKAFGSLLVMYPHERLRGLKRSSGVQLSKRAEPRLQK